MELISRLAVSERIWAAGGQRARLRAAQKEQYRHGYKGNSVKKMDQTGVAGGAKARGKGSADPLGVNSEIGRKLKQYYDGLVSDDVPDRFADLLSQLEKAEPSRKKD